MKDFLTQIKIGLEQNLYFLSLFAALTIPDICSAMESEDGLTTGNKYKNWFDKYMVKNEPEKYGTGKNFTSDDCWNFRCAILHQGRSNHEKSDYKRILFIEPPNLHGIGSIHACIVGAYTEEKSLLINVEKFCFDIIKSANEWMRENENSDIYKKNYQNLIKRYPKGIKPVLGCSVIG
ncbi:MAG: hypothetical protein WC475_02335 [Candidatus Paceibacterota bacterium]